MNTLFYGDNLEVLREHVADDSVDLIYLDPPFNSKRDYNILFKEADGLAPASQIKAFGDTWQYSAETEHARLDIADNALRMGCAKLPMMLDGFIDVLGRNDVTAYLIMMAVRLLELRRVLKPTGSFYLHCDPTASHYLKIILDTIFGKENFRNEIVWKRTSVHSDSKTWSRVSDIIFFYTKSENFTFNSQHQGHDESYLKSHYRHVETETNRRFRKDNVLAPRGAGPIYEWNGQTRAWRYTEENMRRLHDEGRLIYTKSGMPEYKRYLDEMAGTLMSNVWTDISPLNSQAQERLGYPTQKPEALLERIIRASSNEGDVVLDPFCGCGTSISVAQKLGRGWLGIDVTYLSIALIESRLKAQHELKPKTDYRVVGVPADLASALDLFRRDAYQFQFWALTLIPAFPQSGQNKKGADRGIDGLISFVDGLDNPRTHQIIVQVKGGGVSVPHIRDLRGVVEREKAAMGFYVCLESPTKPMLTEAAGAGLYRSERWKRDFPRLQIRTVEELLAGARFEYPSHAAASGRQAARVKDNTDQAAFEM